MPNIGLIEVNEDILGVGVDANYALPIYACSQHHDCRHKKQQKACILAANNN